MEGIAVSMKSIEKFSQWMFCVESEDWEFFRVGPGDRNRRERVRVASRCDISPIPTNFLLPQLRCPGTAWLKHISFSRLRFPRAITCAQPEIPESPSPLSRLYSKFQAQCPDNEYPYIRAINICYKLNRMRKGSTQGARRDRHNM